ncbi:MAG: hypothetical protein KH020_16855 [Clostridiales bacterium]|nr:hypothetical protein [Clostridiales bacterium]
MFEVIDPVLRIESCNLSDLTFEEVNCFLGQWEKGAKISSLMAFCKADRTLILNKDHEKYNRNLLFCQRYMSISEEKRNELRNQCEIPVSKLSLMNLIDDLLEKRYVDREVYLLQHSEIYDYQESIVLDRIIENNKDKFKHLSLTAVEEAFLYGKIQGKREERARRKERSSKPQNIKEEIIKNVNDTQYSKSLDQLLVLSKILSKKCKGVEYAEKLSWKEQVIGFIIDD